MIFSFGIFEMQCAFSSEPKWTNGIAISTIDKQLLSKLWMLRPRQLDKLPCWRGKATLAAPVAIYHRTMRSLRTRETLRQRSPIYPLAIIEVERGTSQAKLWVGLRRILGQTRVANKVNPLTTPPQPASMPTPSRKIRNKVNGT